MGGLQKLKMWENPDLIRCTLLTLYLEKFFANGEQKTPNLHLNTNTKDPQLLKVRVRDLDRLWETIHRLTKGEEG